MVKQKETKPSQVVIFVEGDTDEILFKALIEYFQNEYLPEAKKKGFRETD